MCLLFDYFLPDYRVNYGDSLSIPCTADAVPAAQTKWKLPSSDEFKIFDGPLEIPSVNATNEGYYICELDNGIERPVQRKVLVRVDATEPPVIFKPNFKSINISEGDDITLVCHCEMCEPLETLMWTFEDNNHTIHESKSNDIQSDRFSNKLDFFWKKTHVKANDSGTYTCQLINAFGTDVYSIDVNVKQPPTVQPEHSYHKCNANKDVTAFEVVANNAHTIAPVVYDCSASNGVNATIVILGKFTAG